MDIYSHQCRDVSSLIVEKLFAHSCSRNFNLPLYDGTNSFEELDWIFNMVDRWLDYLFWL